MLSGLASLERGRADFMAKSTQAGSDSQLYYLLHHSPGPNWVPGKMIWEQPEFQGHVAFLSDFFDRRQGVLGGPLQDGSGGFVVLQFSNLEEARSTALEDPAVKAQVLNVAVYPWLVVKSRDSSSELTAP